MKICRFDTYAGVALFAAAALVTLPPTTVAQTAAAGFPPGGQAESFPPVVSEAGGQGYGQLSSDVSEGAGEMGQNQAMNSNSGQAAFPPTIQGPIAIQVPVYGRGQEMDPGSNQTPEGFGYPMDPGYESAWDPAYGQMDQYGQMLDPGYAQGFGPATALPYGQPYGSQAGQMPYGYGGQAMMPGRMYQQGVPQGVFVPDVDPGFYGGMPSAGSSYGAGFPGGYPPGMFASQGDLSIQMLERLDAIVESLGRIEKLLQSRNQ